MLCAVLGFVVGSNRSWSANRCPGITIKHLSGDPCDEKYLQELIGSETIYSTAIVLGSGPGKTELSAEVRDSRVLQMMLILRKLTEAKNQTMHVVGENAVDQTSQLALGPHVTKLSDADFVNTQAIIARTLVLNLAYPQVILFRYLSSAVHFNTMHAHTHRSGMRSQSYFRREKIRLKSKLSTVRASASLTRRCGPSYFQASNLTTVDFMYAHQHRFRLEPFKTCFRISTMVVLW